MIHSETAPRRSAFLYREPGWRASACPIVGCSGRWPSRSEEWTWGRGLDWGTTSDCSTALEDLCRTDKETDRWVDGRDTDRYMREEFSHGVKLRLWLKLFHHPAGGATGILSEGLRNNFIWLASIKLTITHLGQAFKTKTSVNNWFVQQKDCNYVTLTFQKDRLAAADGMKGWGLMWNLILFFPKMRCFHCPHGKHFSRVFQAYLAASLQLLYENAKPKG